MRVRRAKKADRSLVVETVAAAFVNDPAFCCFFGTGGEFAAKAAVFAGYLFDKRIAHDTVWVTTEVDAVSLWSPPDHMCTDDDRGRTHDLERAMIAAVGPQSAGRLETGE
jgi:hypothetical protein